MHHQFYTSRERLDRSGCDLYFLIPVLKQHYKFEKYIRGILILFHEDALRWIVLWHTAHRRVLAPLQKHFIFQLFFA